MSEKTEFRFFTSMFHKKPVFFYFQTVHFLKEDNSNANYLPSPLNNSQHYNKIMCITDNEVVVVLFNMTHINKGPKEKLNHCTERKCEYDSAG